MSSSSHLIQQTSQAPKTTNMSPMAESYRGNSAPVDGIVKSSHTVDSNAKKVVVNTPTASNNSHVVSTEHPYKSLYQPLLALAMLLERESPQLETEEAYCSEDQSEKPSSWTYGQSGANLNRPMPGSNLTDSARKNRLETPSTKFQKTTQRPKTLPSNVSTSTKNENIGIMANARKITPPIKKKTTYKHKIARESIDQQQANEISQSRVRIDEATWNSNYENLVKYHAIHGNSNVLRSDPNKQLSGWVKRQRNNLKDGKLSPSKIAMLDELDFVWNRIDGKWYKKFCQLVRFQKKFGHCYVTAKYDRSLAEWTQRQRRDYKNRTSKMTDDRIQKLEALQGWSWDKLNKDRTVEPYASLDGLDL